MRKAVAIVFWWAVLLGLWQLFVGQTTKQTTFAGLIAAALAAGAAGLLVRLDLYRFRLDRGLLARGATIPWYLVRDFAVVALALLRGRPGGRFVEFDFRAQSAGDRALVGVLGSMTPNAYVVDVDRERRLVLVHELEPKRSKGGPL